MIIAAFLRFESPANHGILHLFMHDQPPSLPYPLPPRRPDALGPCLAAAGRLLLYTAGGRWRRAGHRPGAKHAVPEGFAGVCVAANADPAGDGFIIDRLRDLGIRHVRLDLAYPEFGQHQTRLLQKLLAEKLHVCLHLVQPRAEAGLMSRRRGAASAAAAERWRAFVDDMLARWGAAESVEIGATCNRRKWSGQSLAAFVQAWQIAWPIARRRGVKIIGPNVTDFEPAYNFYLLDHLRRLGCPPDAHTDNLFVERATEPENYDHKILGYRAAGWLRCNLIRKARLLQDIGAVQGAPRLICSHTAWSLRRIARLLDHVEEKQADYLARYLLLAAAANALERVYWGPLIGQREGLIDDGTAEYPDPPHVTLYHQARGNPADYRLRPAFHALAAVQKFLHGAVFQRAHTSGQALEILEFTTPDGLIRHAVWSVNGRCAAADDCYHPAALAAAACADRDGRPLPAPPAFFGESPTYLAWNQPAELMLRQDPAPCDWRLDWHQSRQNAAPLHDPAWLGIQQTRASGGEAIAPTALLAAIAEYLPDGAAAEAGGAGSLPDAATTILRAGRNRVWRRPAPWQPGQSIVIKRFKVPGRWRRLLDWRKPSKAIRSWNGAQELLRRGLPTPRPLACITPRRQHQPAYYVCEDFRQNYSARDIFTALAGGADAAQQVAAADWYAAISGFLVKLHGRGVFFRDLSAGNLLMRRRPNNGTIEFGLIDTARARFYPWPLPLRQRLSDLTRICHPLHWPGRRQLLTAYMQSAGRTFQPWMCLPLLAYDWKHILKNAIKPWRRRP